MRNCCNDQDGLCNQKHFLNENHSLPIVFGTTYDVGMCDDDPRVVKAIVVQKQEQSSKLLYTNGKLLFQEGDRRLMLPGLMFAHAVEASNFKTLDGASLDVNHVWPKPRSGSCDRPLESQCWEVMFAHNGNTKTALFFAPPGTFQPEQH